MSAKFNGVLSKMPSEMTDDEVATWDALTRHQIEQIHEAVIHHHEQLQKIQDDFERRMFDAGLWTYDAQDEPPASGRQE